VKIALFGKRFGEAFNQKCSCLLTHLRDAGAEVFVYKPFYDFLSNEAGLEGNFAATFSGHADLPGCDMMLSIGGDGTYLDAVTVIRDRNIPIAGINTGRLGFLADIAMEELPHAVMEILDGKFTTRQLDLLTLETSTPWFGELNFALNELSVLKRDSSSMITIHTYLDNEFLTTYWADGLIIATPTGSTAYSLSVGGPIVHPSSGEFVITPIAPHNLTMRPLVVPNSIEIALRVEGRGGKFLASLDSRNQILDDSVHLKVKKATFTIPVIDRMGKSFYATLRSKLMWGTDPRN